ncbi:hypothetical protein [Streptomyces sp. IBSBF 2435]|uniref:hypothetical protein n=1 Tax=Streptomyces sp. IBSBF 2435 TaxID=2903531 RepID=UPI002FDC1AF7
MHPHRTPLAVAAGAVLLLALTACSGADASASDPAPAHRATTHRAAAATAAPTKTVGKYDQTWTKGYADTPCSDFLTTMTDHERWVTAADMLTNLRQVDGGDGLPDDSEVDRFQTDMATACEGGSTVKITDIGTSVYLIDPTYKP